MELALSTVLLSINQIVIDGNDILIKVTILPTQTNNLTHTASSSQQYGKQRKPMAVYLASSNKFYKSRLLRLG